MHRRTTPRVQGGQVQKKHRWELTPDYAHGRFDELRFDRQAPGRGYRHLLGRRDVERFLALLPDWDELSTGLQAVLLTPGEPRLDGYHCPGVVAVCAWPQELWQVVHREHVGEHEDLLDALDVGREPLPRGRVRLLWTRPQARAYQLIHVLLHELGHHHDRMTTPLAGGRHEVSPTPRRTPTATPMSCGQATRGRSPSERSAAAAAPRPSAAAGGCVPRPGRVRPHGR